MPIRLDTGAPDFTHRFDAFLATKREAAEDVVETARAIIADIAARGDTALIELTRRFDRLDLDRIRLKVSTAEIESRRRAMRARRARCAEARARSHRSFSSPPAPGRRALHRFAGRRARPSLDADRRGRPLRAGRHRRLSVLGADERGAGQGRRRRPAWSWRCRRRTASSIRWCSPPRNLPASTRSIASAAPRRSRRSPMAPRRSSRWRRSSGRAMPMWRRPSGSSSARSAST